MRVIPAASSLKNMTGSLGAVCTEFDAELTTGEKTLRYMQSSLVYS